MAHKHIGGEDWSVIARLLRAQYSIREIARSLERVLVVFVTSRIPECRFLMKFSIHREKYSLSIMVSTVTQ